MSNLADKRYIANLLATHSQAIDDVDEERLAGTYHRGGAVAYGFFNGPGTDFARTLCSSKHGGPRSLHRTSNTLIEITGDIARAESRVVASSNGGTADEPTVHLIGGRYLDRLERRTGEWKIAQRTYVLDWNISRAREEVPSGASLVLEPARAARLPLTLETARARQAMEEASYLWAYHVDRRSPLPGADAAVALGLQVAKRTFHALSPLRLTNCEGEVADAVTSVLAHALYVGTQGEERERLISGRFIDRFALGVQGWQLAKRRFEAEWTHDAVSSNVFGAGLFAPLTVGTYDREDPGFNFLSAAHRQAGAVFAPPELTKSVQKIAD